MPDLPVEDGVEWKRVESRRAEFVYEAARLAALAAGAPIIPAPWADRDDSFRTQFLEVIERQSGPSRSESPEELHGSWVQAYIDMEWRYGESYDPTAKTHPDMVPYAKLGQLEQDKDSVFVALCEIARQWIRDAPSDAYVPVKKKTRRWQRTVKQTTADAATAQAWRDLEPFPYAPVLCEYSAVVEL